MSRNRSVFIVLAVLLLFGVLPASRRAAAQESRVLNFGIPVAGVISVPETDIPRFSHAYSFYARAQHYQYGVTYQNTGASPIAIELYTAANDLLFEVRVEAGDGGSLGRLPLPVTGEYYLVVNPLDENVVAEYSLTLIEGDLPVLPALTAANNGVIVTLTWRTGADLNLELRDPTGAEVHRRNPSIANARYSGDQTCVSTDPREDITWLAGEMPVGVYEILIIYGAACEGSPAIEYTMNVIANGITIDSFSNSLSSGETGIAQFEVTPSGDVRAGFVIGGLASGEVAEISSVPMTIPMIVMYYAQPFDLTGGGANGTITLTGYISNDAPYTVYQFEGVEGDVITFESRRESGSLDTLLIITDRYQQPEYFFFNDDATPPFAAGNGSRTDSAVRDLQLPYTGTYMIAVTRYGQEYGGTEGRFTLTLRRGTSPQG